MKHLLVFTVALLSFHVHADLQLRSLKDASMTLIPPPHSKPALGVVFKKDCVPCRKQVRSLKCLEKDFDIFLIGSFSSETSLREEYLKMGQPYPAFYGDPKSLSELKVTSQATPQLLLFNGADPKIHLGYRKCESYKKIFQRSSS